MTTVFLSLPLWMQFLAGFILLGLGLLFILMPFSIFGVKPRLEEVELQLNEVRAELRIIAMRLAQGAGETGPSGEPIYTPPRRAAAQGASVEQAARPADPVRKPATMPWSAQPSRQASPRPVEESPKHAPMAQETSPRDIFPERDPVFDDRRDRHVPPALRDDYSYAESGAQENIERILRPTHFEPPPPREAPRPPRNPVSQGGRATQGFAPTLSNPMPPQLTPQNAAPQNPASQTNDEAWRLKLHRQEMAPRGAAAEAERLRQAEESGARRVRSEPTLRWPPRP